MPQRELHDRRHAIRQRLSLVVVLLTHIILTAVAAVLESAYSQAPEAYHTSALSGYAWVMELLTGHPERIRCELGMHRHVFVALVTDLRNLGHIDSRSVSLEEQVAIFLYMCVTGLTVRHVGERFQRSNDTISKCVAHFVLY
jgi:hypothetical protein